MSHYPTEDGFKDERELPDDFGEDYTHSMNGMCPVCGGETFEVRTGGECDEHVQRCEDADGCHWESNPLYDC